MAVGMHNPRVGLDYHDDYDFGLRASAAGMSALVDRTLAPDHDFTRTVARFRRTRRASGRDLAKMETPGQAVDALRELGATPANLAALKLGAHRTAAAVTAQALIAMTTALGLTRRFAGQERVACVLQLLEQRRGVREVQMGSRATDME
jgi:hypothetical protein